MFTLCAPKTQLHCLLFITVVSTAFVTFRDLHLVNVLHNMGIKPIFHCHSLYIMRMPTHTLHAAIPIHRAAKSPMICWLHSR